MQKLMLLAVILLGIQLVQAAAVDRESAVVHAAELADPTAALYVGVARRDVADVRLAIANNADVNALDVLGRTALIGVVQDYRHVRVVTEIVELLLSARAKVDAVDRRGLTALWWAVSRRQSGAVRLLLEAGADISTNSGSRSPLEIARINADSTDLGESGQGRARVIVSMLEEFNDNVAI